MDSIFRPTRPERVLATDLDGTLIPLAEAPDNPGDLNRLTELIRQHDVTLTFVTGRHLASVQKARSEFSLPSPDWIICDVGTSIYHLNEDGEPVPVRKYADHLNEMILDFPLPKLKGLFADLGGLRLQEEGKQGRFKLSYYADAVQLDDLVGEINRRLDERHAPYSLISSVDPFTGDGLIDLLPKGVSKAHALNWWCDFAEFRRSSVVFAGDSGNDLAAFTAGYHVIVVSNADRKVAQQVHDELKTEEGFVRELYLANAQATSGVLEGCRWFQLFSDDTPSARTAGPVRSWGATPLSLNTTHFRVWAPNCESVSVEVRRGVDVHFYPLHQGDQGDFYATIHGVGPLDYYRYRLEETISRPDPVSRYQPQGIHGESMVIDAGSFPWKDQSWPGIARRDLVLYELHIGAFTPTGTFRSAIDRLPELKKLGITAVELMPVAQTPGRWNWGYDGVGLFAPRNTYGAPDDFKAFVDACHAEGLAVILDVVYNHVGPEGNYWADFAPYYSNKHHTPWGEAFAFDGPNAENVRRFVVENALYWLREYHLDGLRLDAVHCMYDESSLHILEEIRAKVAEFRESENRQIHLIAEANIYDPELLPADSTSLGYDAVWCDDIMHSIYAVITPETNVTHREYQGPGDLAESLEHGFIYRGMPLERMTEELRLEYSNNPASTFRENFVIALQNHDNVGNHPHGKRVHQLSSPAHQKAAAALVLLYPAIPLIFMGEEIAASAPFRFFTDFEDEALRNAVDQGRAREYPAQVWEGAVSPIDERAFRESVIGSSDDPSMFGWYQSLLAVRKDWRRKGLLKAEGFQSFWHPEANLFGFRYEYPDSDAGFVLARLYPADETPRPVSVGIEGEVILDSTNSTSATSDSRIELNSPGVIVGRGHFTVC